MSAGGGGRATWFSERQRGTADSGTARAPAVVGSAAGGQGGPVCRRGRDARRYAELLDQVSTLVREATQGVESRVSDLERANRKAGLHNDW